MGKFKTKARAIELLGRKQIRDSVTALAELMKNSYDADAPWLRVEFGVDKEEGHIIIADGGFGMTYKDIEEKWLVLGTNSKTNSKDKLSPGGRTLMGAKGIGRLASARLGKQLWMFTKTKEGLWNIVYINWNLFENPYLALEDIQIPVKYDITANEIVEQFEMIKKGLVESQKKNLELEEWFIKWTGKPQSERKPEVRTELLELYRDTQSCIEKCSITLNIIKKFLSIKKGTILYIDELNDDNWEKCFAPVSADKKNEDLVTQKYFNRLATFVSTFRHAGTENDPFDVKIYVNNELWDEDYAYIDEDYDIYDVKINGNIKNGKFYGTIDARNANIQLIKKANDILSQGREVTQGIANWKEVDCGPYSLKLCHIEGEKIATGLSEDDYARIRRKLEVTGGVCVYRDGVRVLPYGEPENDFLNMEERRSYNAGAYLFSHRNIFGRIDIDSYNNPLLEDKSSREGLIENSQYFYFIKTMENLLIDLAVNFLSDTRKDSLAIRKSFVDSNKQEKEDRKKKAEIEKEEKRRSIIYIKEIKGLLISNKKQLVELKEKIDSLISNWKAIGLGVSVNIGYNKILSALDKVTIEYDTMNSLIIKKQEELEITISKRFLSYFNEELCKDIENYNSFKNKELHADSFELSEEFTKIKNYLQQKVKEWEKAVGTVTKSRPETYKALLIERVQSVTLNSNSLLQDIDVKIYANQEILKDKTDATKQLLSDIDNYVSRIKENDKYIKSLKEIDKISLLKDEVESIFDNDPESVVLKGDELLQNLECIYQETYKLLQILQLDVNNLFEEYLQHVSRLNVISNSEYSDEDLIGELRLLNTHLQSENEIYSDLANLGLASEIVSHEFNQLYTNVRNAIRNLTPYIKESNAKYWLRQIEMGFRAVSDRQNQLSPMYRSYSLRKRSIKLKEFLDEICSFMSNILEKEGIRIDNQISKDVELDISPSKMFPAISNVVNNASYWVLNKDLKIIRFRYDESENALYIEDSGTGITAFDKESIFQPFVSFKPNGRGLGLAIVKKVLESQGYTINIASEEEKTLSGACFKITFGDK